MTLKIELKPNERILLGDCVITNGGHRTRLTIDGALPILREKDIMSLRAADTPAKRLYLAVQFIYVAKDAKEHYALYRRLAGEMVKRVPGAAPFIECINKRILTGDVYKALKEAGKLITYEREHDNMNYASKAYAKVAKETASPRDLEANLLLQAAAKLQAVHDSWGDKPKGLDEAVLYNRRLWTVFLDAVIRDDNKLPLETRQNLTNLGIFIMGETFELITKPKPENLKSIIKINRRLAAGLRGRA